MPMDGDGSLNPTATGKPGSPGNPITSGDEYIESLRGRGLKVYLFGELVDEPVDVLIIALPAGDGDKSDTEQSQRRCKNPVHLLWPGLVVFYRCIGKGGIGLGDFFRFHRPEQMPVADRPVRAAQTGVDQPGKCAQHNHANGKQHCCCSKAKTGLAFKLCHAASALGNTSAGV